MLKFWVLEPAYEGAGPEDSTRYLAVWDKGYLQPRNEWGQFINPSRWNWVTFSFAHVEVDYDRCMGYPHLSIEFVLLGLGLRLHQSLATEEEEEALDDHLEDFWGEMEARSTQTEQLEKLWASIPDDVKAEHVEKSLREQIELGLSEPEEGKRKIVASPQALRVLRETE